MYNVYADGNVLEGRRRRARGPAAASQIAVGGVIEGRRTCGPTRSGGRAALIGRSDGRFIMRAGGRP